MRNYIFIIIGLFIFGFFACEKSQTTEQKATNLLPYLKQTTLKDTTKSRTSIEKRQAKPPSQTRFPYEIYAWQRSKEGAKIIILGKNLFTAKRLFVDTEEIALTPSNDGKQAIGNFPNTEQEHPMYVEIGGEIVQMKGYFSPQEDVPQVNKCNFTFDNSLVPPCQVNDAEQYVRFDCQVQNYQSYTGYVTAHIGNLAIPNSQITFQENFSVISGYIPRSQLENMDAELPFSVDFGNGLQAVSVSSFILP